MQPVITTAIGISVKIEWLEPNSGSMAIEGYLIEILTSDEHTFAQADSCDGSDPQIQANKFCTVDMSTLISAPFSLPQGRLIQVRVSAKNDLGFSIPSTLNTIGVTAKRVPHKPQQAPTRGIGTSPLQLVVEYAILTGD